MKDIRTSGYWIMKRVLELKEYGLIVTHEDSDKRKRYESIRPILCDDPWGQRYVWQPQEAFADVGLVDRAYSPDGSLDHVELIELTEYVPCKVCKQCQHRKLKQLVWDIRNVCGAHRHNYFLTLTFGKQFRLDFGEHAAAENQGVKSLGAFFDYLRHAVVHKNFWVKESHADGFPHFHVMISTNVDADIKEMTKTWWQRFGISNVKYLGDSEQVRTHANYMAKYMFKNGIARWGRSHGYSGAAQQKASSDG